MDGNYPPNWTIYSADPETGKRCQTRAHDPEKVSIHHRQTAGATGPASSVLSRHSQTRMFAPRFPPFSRLTKWSSRKPFDQDLFRLNRTAEVNLESDSLLVRNPIGGFATTSGSSLLMTPALVATLAPLPRFNLCALRAQPANNIPANAQSTNVPVEAMSIPYHGSLAVITPRRNTIADTLFDENENVNTSNQQTSS